jgi:hypothetical protein
MAIRDIVANLLLLLFGYFALTFSAKVMPDRNGVLALCAGPYLAPFT